MPDEASTLPPEPPKGKRALLPWPPPGLERIQGDLWKVVREMGIGGVLLVLPLLWEVTSDTPFHAYGPLGASWWVLAVLTGVGLILVVVAFVDLFRLCRRAARAMKSGFGAATVLTVAADYHREAGLLLQGARAFSVLGAIGRRRVLFARVCTAVFALVAAVWLPTGFVLGIYLSGRGAFGPAGLLYLVLMPVAVACAAAFILRGWEHRTTSRARKRWYAQPWTQDLVREEISDWQEEAEERTPRVGLVSEPLRVYRLGFTVAGGAAVLAGMAVVVWAVVLTAVSAMGPVLTSIAMPRFTGVPERAVKAEFLRRYVVEPDPSIAPEEAGRLFHSLFFVGEGRVDDSFVPPEPHYERGWFAVEADRDNPTGLATYVWADSLFPALESGELPSGALAYLEELGAHPARPLFARAATAPAVDVAGARYRMPFPEGTSYWSLPIPRMTALREAAYAHVGYSASLAARGREEEAERVLREVTTAGVLVADNGVTLIESFIGYVLAEIGAQALTGFYRYAGRDAEADDLEWVLESASAAARVASVSQTTAPAVTLATMPEVVADRDAPRGLRWEYLSLLNTFAPCLNLHGMVFGLEDEYRGWIDRVEDGLVRYPGEREMFALVGAGMFGPTSEIGGAPAWVRHLVALPLGGEGAASSCVSMIGTVATF